MGLSDEWARNYEIWCDPKGWRSVDADPEGFFDEHLLAGFDRARLVAVEGVERGPDVHPETVMPLHVGEDGAVTEAEGNCFATDVDPLDASAIVYRVNNWDAKCDEVEALRAELVEVARKLAVVEELNKQLTADCAAALRERDEARGCRDVVEAIADELHDEGLADPLKRGRLLGVAEELRQALGGDHE